MVYQLEKMLKENGDKLAEEDKKKLEEAIEKGKKDFETTDLDTLKKSLEELTNVSNEVFTKMYQNAQASAQANQQTSNNENNNNDNNNNDNPDEIIVD